MRKFFENKAAFAATVLAFAMAIGINAFFGVEILQSSTSGGITIAREDPTIPPCPWDCSIPDGNVSLKLVAREDPTIPPCPWDCSIPDGNVARKSVA